MKSLTSFLVALAVEGIAAVLVAGLLLSPSGDEPNEPIDDTDSALSTETEVEEPKPVVVAWLKSVLAPNQSSEPSNLDGAEEVNSETEVAARLDHASADLNASLERELDRILEPFIDPNRHDAARSD